MALVSISEAARLAGTARSNLYKSYIETGILSITKDSKGKPKVDTSELLRVFGELKTVQDNSTPQDTQQDGTDKKKQDTRQDAGHQAVIDLLKQQLDEAKEREQFYQQQIRELTNTMKLLEHRPQPRRQWWNFWKGAGGA